MPKILPLCLSIEASAISQSTFEAVGLKIWDATLWLAFSDYTLLLTT